MTQRPVNAALSSRLDLLQSNGGTPLFPEVARGQYLLAHWFDLGLTATSGMGLCPLSFQEIKAFSQCLGVELLSWESVTLRRMSVEYLMLLSAGETPECLPPYGDPVNQFDREIVEKKISSAFRALISARVS